MTITTTSSRSSRSTGQGATHAHATMNAEAQNQELMRLYRIRKTVLKMLSKRGYNVLDQTLEATFQTFAVRVSAGLVSDGVGWGGVGGGCSVCMCTLVASSGVTYGTRSTHFRMVCPNQRPQEEINRISLENNNCTPREACTINVGKIDDPNDVVFVFFSDDEKVREGQIDR